MVRKLFVPTPPMAVDDLVRGVERPDRGESAGVLDEPGGGLGLGAQRVLGQPGGA